MRLSVIVGAATIVAAAGCGSGGGGGSTYSGDGGKTDGSLTHVDGSLGKDGGNTLTQGDGASNTCAPKTCAQLGATCGAQGDGCGGMLTCGSCTAPQTCGGGGTPNACGGNNGCTPTTCAAKGVDCGPLSDGCGGLLQCGTCAAGLVCGINSPGVCAASTIGADGGVVNPCVPKTCADVGVTCGPAGDGCGATLACGTCTAPQSCGGGGTPSACGGTSGCTPKTCAQLSATCGTQGDGCGGTLSCGTCTAPQTCGGGGTANACGGTGACTPKTCAQLGNLNCGSTDDGCGNVISCGPLTCAAGTGVCGGGGQPNVCGPITGTCTGLCLQQTTCTAPATTSVSGTVYAPNGTDPIYNALVYVPNGPVAAFAPGVSCDSCSQEVSGNPLVATHSAVDGTFTLTNMPVGTNIPVVIQLGRWRRQITVNTASCVNTALAATQTNMPTSRAMGDIPLMAFVTGNVDALECVFRKIGILDSEFGDPGGPNRIQLYKGAQAAGAQYSTTTPGESSLWGTQAEIDKYDMVLFACQGTSTASGAAADQQRVINFANAGGRIFATHYNYNWLYNDSPFSTTANWAVDPNSANKFASDPGTGIINQAFPSGAALAQWLKILYPTSTLGQIAVNTLRNDFTGIPAGSQSLIWITVNDATRGPNTPLHYSFDTPVGSAPTAQCGRVVYEDYHVENANGLGGKTFPAECAAGAMTPQEKLLEFELFDLSSCVGTTTPVCIPKTCASQGFTCGPQGDGCGNILQCGTCTAPQTCGGGGTPGQCGGVACVAETCASQNLTCGPAGDGCGNLIQCGTCPAGQACGAGGTPGKCGATNCAPETCSSQGKNCGPSGDGCGGLIQCGTCPAGQACGADGTPGVCAPLPEAGPAACVPETCAKLGQSCGPAGDGCGGLIQCGTCTAPQTCGGGGTPGQCGGMDCTPLTCAAQKLNCGPAGDGCGGLIQCGTCTAPQTCGGGGTPGQCGAAIPPP